MPIRYASKKDHKAIMTIAKQSKFTRDYSNMIFSSDENYKNNDSAVYTRNNKIIAFCNYRHLKRQPTTTLYFITVDKSHQGKGIGKKLFMWALKNSPHKKLTFKVSKNNPEAAKFYKRVGAVKIDDGAFKSGEEYWVFKMEWTI